MRFSVNNAPLIGMLRARRETAGAALVEFALALPLLTMILVGTFKTGLMMNNYIMLTEALRAGGRQFALSRGSSVPYTSTVNRITTAAPNLPKPPLTITLKVDGSTCANDSACQTQLQSAYVNGASNSALGAVTVSATYPCNLIILWINFVPGGCTLSTQITERIE